MPVDRAFTIRGTGTVVTGTVWSGTLARDATLRLFPSGDAVRVRGLQAHGHAVERIHAGERAAIALAGVELVARRPRRSARRAATHGVRPPSCAPTSRCSTTSPDPSGRAAGCGCTSARARSARASSRTAARSRRASIAPARIVVDEPIVARTGDRFVLRGGSPLGTIGGGVVTDPLAPHRARAWRDAADRSRTHSITSCAKPALSGLDVAELPVRLGVGATELDALLASLGRLARRTDACTRRAPEALVVEQIRSTLGRVSRRASARRGRAAAVAADQAPRCRMLSSMPCSPSSSSAGEVVLEQGDVRARRRSPRGSPTGSAALAADLIGRLTAAGAEPPTVEELALRSGRRPAEVASVEPSAGAAG